MFKCNKYYKLEPYTSDIINIPKMVAKEFI